MAQPGPLVPHRGPTSREGRHQHPCLCRRSGMLGGRSQRGPIRDRTPGDDSTPRGQPESGVAGDVSQRIQPPDTSLVGPTIATASLRLRSSPALVSHISKAHVRLGTGVSGPLDRHNLDPFLGVRSVAPGLFAVAYRLHDIRRHADARPHVPDLPCLAIVDVIGQPEPLLVRLRLLRHGLGLKHR